MDAGQLSICGEESFGTGSDHIREKDGIWAALAWLNVLAHKRCSVSDLLRDFWTTYGRSFFLRYDYEECALDGANALMDALRAAQPTSDGTHTITNIDEFSYTDPIDKSVSAKQGLRVFFADGSRVVFRLSGTGSSGATIRVYAERYLAPAPGANLSEDPLTAIGPLVAFALGVAGMEKHTGRSAPTVIT
jgi:phosphoglucomutase